MPRPLKPPARGLLSQTSSQHHVELYLKPDSTSESGYIGWIHAILLLRFCSVKRPCANAQHPAVAHLIGQAQVVDVESEDQAAVGLGFDDLARVPLLLGDPAGVGLREPERDVEVSIAPDRAEAFRHVILGPEAGRAAEALSSLHRRPHPLDLEQPDVVSQVAMANQAPVVVGGKYQVVGIEGLFLCFIPTRSLSEYSTLKSISAWN